jgi:opacity protein-like surface antigen
MLKRIYVLGGLGLAIAKLSIDYPASAGIPGSASDSNTEIGITLGAGTKLKPT